MASENVDTQTNTQDSCFISIDYKELEFVSIIVLEKAMVRAASVANDS